MRPSTAACTAALFLLGVHLGFVLGAAATGRWQPESAAAELACKEGAADWLEEERTW